LAAQIEQLQSERDEATNRLASLAQSGDTELPKELLNLRGEVARLRMDSRELAKLRAESTEEASKRRVGGFIPKEKLANAGFATPEAALESLLAGFVSGDYEQVMAGVVETPEEPTEEGRESFARATRESSHTFQGTQMIAKKVLSEDEVFILALVLDGEEPSIHVHHMVKRGAEWRNGEWRYAGSYSGDSWLGDGQVQWLAPLP